jgi:Na+-transporting methylmalonyl-CoA/oxaloacetate decarboxylase gamma subunit
MMQLVKRFQDTRFEATMRLIVQLVANTILSIGALALLIVGIYLAILDRSAPTITAVLGIGVLFMFLLLLAKFKRFKGLGFEAEMWEEKQEEAAALIDSLKKELDRLRTPRDYLIKGRAEEITKKLTPFAGTEFDGSYARTSGEQTNFWWLLQPALEKAGWKQVVWKYGESIANWSQAGRPATGEAPATNVEIHLHPEQRGKLEQAAVALISALNDLGIDAKDIGFNVHNSNSSAIHILIGEKQLFLPEKPTA